MQTVLVGGRVGTSAEFKQADQQNVLAEIREGLDTLTRLGSQWAAANNVASPCEFVLSPQFILLDIDQDDPNDPTTKTKIPVRTVRRLANGALATNATFDGTEAIWMNFALDELGFGPPSDPMDPSDVRSRLRAFARSVQPSSAFGLGVSDAFPIFVTTFNCHWWGFTEQDPGVVFVELTGAQQEAKKLLDIVFAHEIGHVFMAPDEYNVWELSCSASEVAGPFDTPNANCAWKVHPTTATGTGTPNPAVSPCLMGALNPNVTTAGVTACAATTTMWGWLTTTPGVADLASPPTVDDVTPRAGVPASASVGTPGEFLVVTGTNLWDIESVTFSSPALGDV